MENGAAVVRGGIAVLVLLALVGPAAAAKPETLPGQDDDISVLGLGMPDRTPPDLFQRKVILADGLRSPDGIAVDRETGDIYVSAEDEGAIYRITPLGERQVVVDSQTRVFELRDGKWRRTPALQFPEGIALDGQGNLYAVEDTPGGRLVRFDLSEPDRFRGRVVPIPIMGSEFAWEAIDVRPNGELLLAGSTMEAVMARTGQLDLFRGVVVYRDAEGNWWLLLNHAMTSYSAVCFSVDGSHAMFAAEFPGLAGCLDLRTHLVRTYLWAQTFRSPEGLCALPNGAFLMAEENGSIYWLDPTSGGKQLLHEHDGGLESLAYLPDSRRLLATDDTDGTLQGMDLIHNRVFRSARGSAKSIAFEQQATPVEMIPMQSPPYLEQVLKLGGYDPERLDNPPPFREFAKRYCMVAIDAETELLSGNRPVLDPIKRIQFVVVAPYLIAYQDGELIWSSSGFTVVKDSGQVVKTELIKRQVLHGDLMEARFTPVGGQNIALPVPFSARINRDGMVSVNFLGMGVMSDFYLVLNTSEPDESVMVVVQPDGFVQQYQVRIPAGKDERHWVIALERKDPDTWKSLVEKP